jgi:hypothetical protein
MDRMHDENRIITERNTVLCCQIGSRLHGVVLEGQDDNDMMGIVIEPPEYVIRPPDDYTGFKRFRQYQRRAAGTGRSGPNDEDFTAFSLRKWVGMAVTGNPDALLLLFAPDEFIINAKWPGHDVRRRRDMFLSQRIGESYLGYLDKQTRCLKGEDPGRTNRPDLIDVHGYDTKYAFQALRLAYQGLEMMSSKTLTLPIPRPELYDTLLAVRRGQLSLGWVLDQIAILRHSLVVARATSDLPDLPDFEAISQWMADTYRMWWDEHPFSLWREP